MADANVSLRSLIPSYDAFYLALLEVAKDFGDREFLRKEGLSLMAEKLNLTEEQKSLRYPETGRLVWKTHATFRFPGLLRIGALSREKRAYYRITPKGLELLERARRDPAFSITGVVDEFDKENQRQKHSQSKDDAGEQAFPPPLSEKPAEERIAEIYGEAKSELADEILERLKAGSPAFFEHAVLRLLAAMGYGDSSVQDYVKVVGQSGDGGIDGTIQEDKLGLGFIYVQAKRYAENTVGRPAVQQFVGALAGKNGNKGVFITTSKFSKEAQDYAERAQSRIVLIDGDKLANLMFTYNVGCAVRKVFEIKRIDEDFFEDA